MLGHEDLGEDGALPMRLSVVDQPFRRFIFLVYGGGRARVVNGALPLAQMSVEGQSSRVASPR